MADRAVPGRTLGTGPTDELLAAVAFLTRIPVATRGVREARTGGAAFGIVGAALGAVGAIPLLVLGAAHPLLAAFLALAILAILDGGLHLDGLADTIDALAAPADRAEQARSDPRVGAAGVVGIVLVLGADAAALAEIADRWPVAAAVSFVVATSGSRAAAAVWAVAAARLPAVPRGRLGAWFASSTSGVQAGVATVTAAAVLAVGTEIAGPLIAVGALVGAAASVVVGMAVIRGRHGLDGDGYGAMIELMVASILGATAILGGAAILGGTAIIGTSILR